MLRWVKSSKWSALVACGQHQATGIASDPVGDMHTRRCLACHDARPRGRADAAGGVELRESRALGGQAVNVRRVVEIAAVHSGVLPSHVVDEDDEHVGTRDGLGLYRQSVADAEQAKRSNRYGDSCARHHVVWRRRE